MKPRAQGLVYGCLVLSGSTSLIYELLWTRVFSFSFGSTSLAFAAVLAVFFLGLAGGSILGGRAAGRLKDPLRAYGWLELAIGAYAGISFPFLFKLHHLFALHNAGGTEPSGLAFRFAAAALVLAVPTLCMGATFPILLEHLRRDRSHLTEALGRLYGINTLGAFLGVYLATHWLIPLLGLDKANYTAVALNAVVFLLVVALGGRRRVPAEESSPEGSAHPSSPAAGGASAVPAGEPPPGRLAWVGLILLAASGFTTLAYEVVWGRVLTISLDGSLYGIGTTLGSFLAGIAAGGVAFSFAARRLRTARSLFHAYVLVCLAVIAYLALSRLLLPVEGYLLKSVNQGVRGIWGLHLGFGIGVLFLLPVTAGLGFMFPAAVALYNQGRANPAEGAGRAYALNTLCSVAGSLLSASVLMNLLGIEGIVFLGALVMLGSLLAAVLLAESGMARRRAWVALVLAPMVLAAGWWPAIDAKTVLVGFTDGKPPSLEGLFRSLSAQFGSRNALKAYKDGVGTTLTVTTSGRTVGLQSNGLPQSGRDMDPPYFNTESSMVGLLPVLHKPDARNALVVGLGAGITVGVLRMAAVPQVEVVELEPSMAGLCRTIYPKGESPLDDTGVTLRLDDARNFLVRNGYRKEPRRWDLIASQPAHPWVTGAADLFTEEMFRLAYASLEEGGIFCQWFMISGIDAKAYAALSNAFGRVFDHAMVYRPSGSASGLYFIGTRGEAPFTLHGMEEVMGRPGLRQLLTLHDHRHPADIYSYAATGLVPGSALRTEGLPINRDRNAYVESRMPILPKGAMIPIGGIPELPFSGPLPGSFAAAGAAESLLVFESIDRLSGNLPSPRPPTDPDSLLVARMQAFAARSGGSLKKYYEVHIGLATGKLAPASLDTLAGRVAAGGETLLEARLRMLHHRMAAVSYAAGRPFPALAAGLPEDFQSAFRSIVLLSAAEAAAQAGDASLFRSGRLDSLAAAGPVDSSELRMALVLKAWTLKDTALAPLAPAALENLYRKTLLDWSHRGPIMDALEWDCRVRGYKAWAKFTDRAKEHQEGMAVARLMAKAMRLKDAKVHGPALVLLSRVVELDPGVQNAWLARAEIFGREKKKAAYESLVADIRRVFPMPDVLLNRVEEAYHLNPDALAQVEKTAN